MNTPANPNSDDAPLIEPKLDAAYSLEIVARLTGVPSHTILFYQEQGWVAAAPREAQSREPSFDDDALRAIRRLEHLRTEFELKEPALRLMANLLAEIEHLRHEARSRR